MSNIIDDNILVSRAKSGNAEALTILLEKYSEKIMQKSLTFKNLNGLESDDLYQEGMIGFVAAVYSFDEKLGVQFSTYANTLAFRKMLSAIRKANNKSNLPLQYYVSLEDVVGNNKKIGAVSGNTAESNIRKVNMEHDLVKTARNIGICLGD